LNIAERIFVSTEQQYVFAVSRPSGASACKLVFAVGAGGILPCIRTLPPIMGPNRSHRVNIIDIDKRKIIKIYFFFIFRRLSVNGNAAVPLTAEKR
jgi:hypothetical protein